MFENTLDGYAHSNGLRNVNTYLKVIFAIVTLVVNLVSTSPVIPLVVLLILTYLIIFKAKIHYMFYLKFFTIPFAFAFITFVFMVIFFGVGAHVLDLGIFNLAVTTDGFNLGLLVFARILGGFFMSGVPGPYNPNDRTFFNTGKVKNSLSGGGNYHAHVSLYICIFGRSYQHVPFPGNPAWLFQYEKSI